MRRSCVLFALAVLLLLAATALSLPTALPKLRLDPARTTVSGVSSGGAMATQLQVAYSSAYHGLGVVAGPPYACAGNNLGWALEACLNHPDLVSLDVLYGLVDSGALLGTIDAESNLQGLNVWEFSGTLDTVVVSESVAKNAAFFRHYGANVTYVNSVHAEHSWVTHSFGNNCPFLGSPFINDCDYDIARTMLQALHPSTPLHQPTAPANASRLFSFQQSDFTPLLLSPADISMLQLGFVYIPEQCEKGVTCGLHVALHGCEMGYSYIQSNFTLHSGLNEWADANNLVVLYPQVGASATVPFNPKGCWDWWGYSSPLYAVKDGPQMLTIQSMVNHLLQ